MVSLLTGRFTEEEDRTILTMQREKGNCWAEISCVLLGRTAHAVKVCGLRNPPRGLHGPRETVAMYTR
jgi:hypothetical protein